MNIKSDKESFDEYFMSLGVPDTWRATAESVWIAALASRPPVILPPRRNQVLGDVAMVADEQTTCWNDGWLQFLFRNN